MSSGSSHRPGTLAGRPALVRAAIAATALGLALGCSRPNGASSADAGADASVPADGPEPTLARAEDTRRASEVSAAVQTSHDVRVRRRSARALARIADAESEPALALHLADDDPEVLAWAAYGLGYTCKGREDAHVRLLAARAAALPFASRATPARARGAGELDPHAAIARAIARCGGPLAEPVLVGLLTDARARGGPWLEPALLALGDLAARQKRLGPEAMTALLDAGGDRSAPQELAVYALGRADPGEAFAPRVAEVARTALARPGDARVLAVRALGRAARLAPKELAPELGRIVVDARGYDPGERAEAARALGTLGDVGQAAIAGAIAELTPDAKDAIGIAALGGAPFNVLYTLLSQLAPDTPRKAEPALAVLASLTPPAEPTPGLARRLATIRCSAALALARGVHDAELLDRCDARGSEPWERARLASLLRRPLRGERLSTFRALAKSEHLRIREEAIQALAAHPELGEAAAPLVADALLSKNAGLVATAAELLQAHPDRAMVLAASERRAALDPRAPPPTATPAQELAPVVAKALSAALAASWPEDRFETRIALVEAAASVHHPEAKDAATRGCSEPNPVVRERAAKALRTLGADAAACEAAPRALAPAAELAGPLPREAKVVLRTETGELRIVLEPELSPVTATRIAALVRSGFYDGLVVHRVVPGFVAQLGDPDGDGFGGSGTPLRCETSPVTFRALDVGMALAGRDTGSSQLFVTLARAPHLDGEYTRVGRAEGDWASVAQGDVILDAKIVE